MKRILFISPLDRRTVPNTREQNMNDVCRDMGHRTLSMTLTQNTSRAPMAVLRDALLWRVERLAGGAVIGIDPLFNPCTGLKTNLDVAALQRPRAGSGAALRRHVIGWLSPLGVLRDLAIVPAFLVQALRHGHFDLCIAYGPWAACVGWLLSRLGRVDLLVYDDQDYEPAIITNPVRQRWAAWLERVMMQRADVVVSIGNRLAALRRAQTGREVAVIPNGVRVRVRERRGAPRARAAQVFTLIYVGNVVSWSGLDVMLDSLPVVLGDGRRLRVLVVGDGLPAYVKDLKAKVAALRLDDVVQFVGRVANDRIGEWLSQADVGLAHFRPEAYRRYAFPLKVVEYMAAGLAVIGTRDTETEDILQRHGCGIAVAFDSASIASGILCLADDAALRERCQRQALQAASMYEWPALAARELALVEAAGLARTSARAA